MSTSTFRFTSTVSDEPFVATTTPSAAQASQLQASGTLDDVPSLVSMLSTKDVTVKASAVSALAAMFEWTERSRFLRGRRR